MPETYVYVHGTCGVCGYAGGLVIASTSDPRCWPCQAWAAKIAAQATARVVIPVVSARCEFIEEDRDLLRDPLEPPRIGSITMTQAEANGQSWRPMCQGFVGHLCTNRTVGDGEFCRRHRR